LTTYLLPRLVPPVFREDTREVVVELVREDVAHAGRDHAVMKLALVVAAREIVRVVERGQRAAQLAQERVAGGRQHAHRLARVHVAPTGNDFERARLHVRVTVVLRQRGAVPLHRQHGGASAVQDVIIYAGAR